MHTRNALPHSLLELVCHRISQSNARALDLQNLGRVRQLQHFATDSLPQSGAVGPSIYVFQSSARKRYVTVQFISPFHVNLFLVENLGLEVLRRY